MEEIPIAYPILDQSRDLSVTNIIFDVDYDFVIKYKVDEYIEITLKYSYMVYQQLITKSDLPLDRLYKLIINSLNKEPNYIIDIKLDNNIILDIRFNTKIVDINEQIILIRQSELLVNNVKELDKNALTLFVDKVKKFNNKHSICYLISLLLIVIIQLILSVNKVKELENKLTICNNIQINNNNLSQLENKLSLCNNKLSIRDNKLSICENKLSLCNNKLSIHDNKLSICENKLSIHDDKLFMCNNKLYTKNNNLIESILQLENKLSITYILFICMIINYIIRSLTKTPTVLVLK